MGALFGEFLPQPEKVGLPVDGFGKESEIRLSRGEPYLQAKLLCEAC